MHKTDGHIEETAVVGTYQGNNLGCQTEQDNTQKDAGEEGCHEGGGKHAVGLLFVVSAYGLSCQDGAADAKKYADGRKQRNDWRHDIYGRYGVGAYQITHHDGVGHRGQTLGQ